MIVNHPLNIYFTELGYQLRIGIHAFYSASSAPVYLCGHINAFA